MSKYSYGDTKNTPILFVDNFGHKNYGWPGKDFLKGGNCIDLIGWKGYPGSYFTSIPISKEHPTQARIEIYSLKNTFILYSYWGHTYRITFKLKRMYGYYLRKMVEAGMIKEEDIYWE